MFVPGLQERRTGTCIGARNIPMKSRADIIRHRPRQQPAGPDPLVPERTQTPWPARSRRGDPLRLQLAPPSADAPVLLDRRPVTGDLLRLTLSRPRGFRYLPGQHVKMGVPGLLRTYSFVSAPYQSHLEFFVELFPSGRLSDRLRRIRPGAAMALGDRASGRLRLDPKRANQLMIATVTGIAPYLSLLRHHLHESGAGHRFVILHGASHADELGYAGELSALAQRHPGTIGYVPTVSRPDSPRNSDWRGERGRVESLVEPIIQRFRLRPADTAAFACGHPGMVGTVAALLGKLGFATSTEPFD
jgi:ferredoxin-NADP reductase